MYLKSSCRNHIYTYKTQNVQSKKLLHPLSAADDNKLAISHTDLIKPTLRRKYRYMPIKTRTASSRHLQRLLFMCNNITFSCRCVILLFSYKRKCPLDWYTDDHIFSNQSFITLGSRHCNAEGMAMRPKKQVF